MPRWAYGTVSLCAPLAAWSHGRGPRAESAWGEIWHSEALILSNLLALSLLYGIGWNRMRKRPGAGAARRWTPWCFGASMAALLAALLPPVADLSERLGWVHMIQHTALMMIAAPLFVLGMPGRFIATASPMAWRRALARPARRMRSLRLPFFRVSQPILIWLLFALALWIWHVPVLYEGALRSRPVHDLQHLTFFLTAALFWQALLHPIRRRRLNQGLGILYLFLASIHSTALGVLMALSPVAWYPFYEATAPAMGYSALADQQIAGYIMWMPACMIYAAIAVALGAAWLSGMRDPLPGRQENHARIA